MTIRQKRAKTDGTSWRFVFAHLAIAVTVAALLAVYVLGGPWQTLRLSLVELTPERTHASEHMALSLFTDIETEISKEDRRPEDSQPSTVAIFSAWNSHVLHRFGAIFALLPYIASLKPIDYLRSVSSPRAPPLSP